MKRLSTSMTRVVLVFALASQMVALPVIGHGANLPQVQSRGGAGASNPGVEAIRQHYLKVLADENPIWEEFIKTVPTSLELPFSVDDPGLDQDPFFLRQQEWVVSQGPSAAGPEEYSFQKDKNGVTIRPPNTSQSLRISAPLTPFHATSEFLFFSLDEQSSLFKDATGPIGQDESPGEGLFFISTDRLVERAGQREPIPVYFFPLPGGGWQGAIDSYEFEEADLLAIANSRGDAISIELKDVETLMKGQQLNLMLATSFSLKNERRLPNGYVYPNPGTTAAFGLFFTGLNLSRPADSLWKTATSMDVQGLRGFFGRLLALNPFRSIPARAESLPPDVMERVIYVGSILTGMLALSVVLKYAHPGIRAKIKAKDAKLGPPTGVLNRAGREVRQVFDVFSHVTTTAAQFASVNFANSMELFLDRFAPSVAAAEHTLIRKFMNKTFYFSRNSVKQVPVNAKMFYLGAVVMGVVDTAPVVYQYTVVVPWLCESAAPFLGEYWQKKIEATFATENENLRSIVIQDSVRNAIAYLMSGASMYSMESKAQVLEISEKEVDAVLRAMGKDPEAPEVQNEREQMLKRKVDVILQLRGLPGQGEFLFDAGTLYQQIPRLLGYTSEVSDGTKLLNLRQLYSFFTETLDQARKSSSLGSDANATRILDEARQDLELLRVPLTQGLALRGQTRKHAQKVARQLLVLLDHRNSAHGESVRAEWMKRYSEAAIVEASKAFRQSAENNTEQAGKGVLQVSQDYANMTQESFILAKRHGLTVHALDRAVAAARELLKTQPGPKSQEVYDILKETQSKAGLVKNTILKGREGLAQARDVRRQITLLSYEGPIEWTVKYIPEAWTSRMSPESARTAGLLFRQALYSFLSKEGQDLLGPSKESIERHTVEARQVALKQVIDSHAELSGLTRLEAEAAVLKNHELEWYIRTQLEIARLAREHVANEKAQRYQPPKKSWVHQRQEAKAVKYANAKLTQWELQRRAGNRDSFVDEKIGQWQIEVRDKWKQFFLESMAKQVGLKLEAVDSYLEKYSRDHLRKYEQKAEQEANRRIESLEWNLQLNSLGERGSELSEKERETKWREFYNESLAKSPPHANQAEYAKLMEWVETEASETTRRQMANDRGLNEYLKKVTPFESVKIESSLYALNFLQAYKEAATELEKINPLSPNQPGRFQKIRQTTFVREHPMLTKAIRWTESLVDDQAIKPGLYAKLSRNIPLFEDMWNSHKRFGRNSLSMLSISYLWSYYVWQVHLPYGTWVLMMATGAATIYAPSQWLTRAFRMNGLKPMGGVLSKVAYGLPYSFVTFLGMIPTVLLAPEANLLVTEYVRDPFLGVLAQVPKEVWLGAIVSATAAGSRRVRAGVQKVLHKIQDGATQLTTSRARRASGSQCSSVFSGS